MEGRETKFAGKTEIRMESFRYCFRECLPFERPVVGRVLDPAHNRVFLRKGTFVTFSTLPGLGCRRRRVTCSVPWREKGC